MMLPERLRTVLIMSKQKKKSLKIRPDVNRGFVAKLFFKDLVRACNFNIVLWNKKRFKIEKRFQTVRKL